jgi:MFS family permease
LTGKSFSDTILPSKYISKVKSKMETNTAANQPTPINSAAPATASIHNFWRLWTANGFSNLGDGLYQIILPLLAVQLTDSPSRVATLSVMLSLPWLLFALQAGSIVDRFDRQKVMFWVTCGRVVLLLLLTFAVIMNFISLPFLYVVAFLLGTGETLVDTAVTAIVPAILSRDRLNWANAQIIAMQTVTNTFIGPPLAGFLAGIGFALATGSSTLMYIAAGFALLLMRGAFTASSHADSLSTQQLWTHLTGGLRFLWKDRLIRDLTLFTASMNIFWAGWGALLVLYAVKPGPMALDEFQYGLLLTAMAVGGLSGSMVANQLQRRLGTRDALILDFIGTILLVGIPSLTTNFWAVGASVFIAGMGASIWVILVASIRQQVVPSELLGRVYSASRFVSWGIGPLGATLAGFVAEIWNIRTMFAVGALASILTMLLFLNAIPRQTLQRFDDSKR